MKRLRHGQGARVKPRRKIFRMYGVIAAAVIILATVGYGIVVGWSLTHPARDAIESNPQQWGMAYQRIRFPSAVDHLHLHGWWVPSHGSGLTVVMCHGYGANREESGVPALAVAHALHQMGVNVLLFDFRAEGNSPGHLVSVGVFEQRDVRGAVSYALSRAPQAKVALLGYSMGASTAILEGSTDSRVAGVIADSPFANLSQYLNHNLPIWTHLPAFPFNQIILGILPVLTGINIHLSDPLGVVQRMGNRPLLLIAGTADVTISDRNSVRLYQSARKVDPNAHLWLVPRATHVQAFKVEPVAYLQHVYQFLKGIDPKIQKPPVSYGF